MFYICSYRSKQEQKKVNSDSGLAGSLLTRIKNNIPNNNKKKQIDDSAIVVPDGVDQRDFCMVAY